MIWPEEYRGKVEDVQTAIVALLDASRHDAWIGLRSSLSTINDRLERDAQPAITYPPGGRVRAPEEIARAEQRSKLWEPLTMDQRDTLVLDVIGCDALTLSEWTEKLNERLKTPACGRYGVVDESTVRSMVKRMHCSGKLNREAETYRTGSKQIRYRYSIRRELDGPIVDLERRFHEG